MSGRKSDLQFEISRLGLVRKPFYLSRDSWRLLELHGSGGISMLEIARREHRPYASIRRKISCALEQIQRYGVPGDYPVPDRTPIPLGFLCIERRCQPAELIRHVLTNRTLSQAADLLGVSLYQVHHWSRRYHIKRFHLAEIMPEPAPVEEQLYGPAGMLECP